MAPGSLDLYVYAILGSIFVFSFEQKFIIFNSIILIVDASFLMCFPAISKNER